MSGTKESSSPFEGWEHQSFSQRVRNFGEAKMAAKEAHRTATQNARRELETNNPDAYAEIVTQERREATARREEVGQRSDPITNPVAAYYEERERMGLERNADIDGEQRRVDELMASNDPISQYVLEQGIKEIASFGPSEKQ